MKSKQAIHDFLLATDGIKRVLVIEVEPTQTMNIEHEQLDLLASMRVFRAAEDLGGMRHLTIGPISKARRKIIATSWPKYHVAVEVDVGHEVCKSLRRMLLRLGRRHGGLEVESKTCAPSEEQPAASSSEEIPY